jgi:hypothetical protein
VTFYENHVVKTGGVRWAVEMSGEDGLTMWRPQQNRGSMLIVLSPITPPSAGL